MNPTQRVLAQAIHLEEAATRRYEELADAMQTWGNAEVEAFFRMMGEFSRRHLQLAMTRGGFRHVPRLDDPDSVWPDRDAPECAAWMGIDGMIDAEHACSLALEAENQGYQFYLGVAERAPDPKVRALAEAFAAEEAEHVAALQRLTARYTR